jgi:cyanate lyase
MSLPQPALPSPVTPLALPTRDWAQSVLLHYKSLASITFTDLAHHLHLSEVYTTSMIYQQHQMTNDEAKALCTLLKVPLELVSTLLVVLTQPVVKGMPSKAIPTDPCIYRLYEILQVYGSSFHALVSVH